MTQENLDEFVFPESLTMEKIIGVTWKADRNDIHLITPVVDETHPAPSRIKGVLDIITKPYLNSLKLSKTGDVYATYISENDKSLQNTMFFSKGRWRINPNNKEELFVKMDSPQGLVQFKLRVGKFYLLNNVLVMEAYCINPNYSFSVVFYGKGYQDQYWSKETDLIDPSWEEKHQISQAPIKYSDIIGSYNIGYKEWKRVTYIDDLSNNTYPLLTKCKLTFNLNGIVNLNGLDPFLFGFVDYKGYWTVDGNKVNISFPSFPFRGNLQKYSSTFEVDNLPLYGPMYARQNVGLTMEIVEQDTDKILVRITEPGICSAFIYLNQ